MAGNQHLERGGPTRSPGVRLHSMHISTKSPASESGVAKEMPVGGNALSCSGLRKVFPVLDEGSSWRVMVGNSRHARNVVALENITLSVPKGEFVGILGRNGAGKSTLLRTLAGVHAPSSGRVDINGSLSGLFELGGLCNRFLTGRAYAKRMLELQDTPRAMLPALIDDVQRFSELGKRFDDWILTYSSGMAARLYFATATAAPCDVYLIDEVLSVGDEYFQAKCRYRLRERARGGASGILVTHDWSAILRLCSEAHIMEHGRITRSGRADQVVQAYLQLATPERGIARFSASNPSRYEAFTNEDAVIPFEIDLAEAAEITLGFSVEMLRIGSAWEVLLLQNHLPLVSTPGKHRVSLTIPRLPLSAGNYLLNLFLTSPTSPAGGSLTIYDARSWTHGNAVELVVRGEPCGYPAALPAFWKVSSA